MPTSNACDYCGHYPTKHQAVGQPASSPSPAPSSSSYTSSPSSSSSPANISSPRPSPASIKPSPSPAPPAAAAKSPAPTFVLPRKEKEISTPHTAVSSRSPSEKPMKTPAEWFKDKTKKKKA